MTSTLTDVRNALKQTIVTAGLGLQVASTVQDATTPPAVVIDMANAPTIDYTQAFSMGGDRYNFDLMVLVANNNVTEAQKTLDQFISGKGPKSIRQYLFQHGDLGLPDVDAMATQVRGYGGSPDVAGIKMLGAIMRVIVTVG